MDNCLHDYIGLRGCSTGQPVSGLYVDSLPGISRALLDAIADKEERTAEGVWENVQNLAIQQFEFDVLEALSGRFNTKLLKNVNPELRLKKPYEVTDQTTDALQGVRLQFKDGRYTRLNINALKVYSAETTTVNDVTFFVYDTFDGSLVYEKTVDVKPGVNVISVEWVIEPRLEYRYFFVGYESKFATIKSRMQNEIDGCCEDVWSDCCCDYLQVRGAFAEVATDPIIDANLEFGSDTFGLGLTYNVGCSIMAFICENRNLFKTAFYYLLGVKIMELRLQSERANAWTEINTDQNKEWLGKNYDKYKKILQTTLDMICLPCDCCFEKNTILTQIFTI